MNFLPIFALICLCNGQDYVFPDEFLLGTATASYQIEGAWNTSGKGENIWDWLTHTNPCYASDCSNGDIACDSYNKIEEDVAIMRDMGVNLYRFSLSWSRLLPNGHSTEINEDGVRYYNELIDALLENEITPLVTIYHWDLPIQLHELGGWTNPLIANYFVDYADVVFGLFGDRVKHWITFNEPQVMCEEGYASGILAPAYNQEGIGDYLCSYTVLVAHGRTYELYDQEYRESQGGKIGISIASNWFEPESDSAEDAEAVRNMIQMNGGWFAHPIYSEEGDWPLVMRQRIDAISEEEGFSQSRLPYFTVAEVELIRGSADFFGINHYSSRECRPMSEEDYDEVAKPSHSSDIGSYCYTTDEWGFSSPLGLRRLLNWIKEEYGDREIIITENGSSDNTGEFDDCNRINYFNLYLGAVLDAIYEDEVNVIGYAAWTLMDNFEWSQGYTSKFGLHHVDFDDPDRTRTPKMSAHIFKNIIATRAIDWNYVPDGFTACIW